MVNEKAHGTVVREGGTAVYIPFKTFQTSVETFKPGLPPRLDRTAWTFSNIIRGQVLSAYKFLGLVDDDGIVQPILKELVSESLESDKGKMLLADTLKSKYPKVVSLAEQNATIGNLQDAMRELRVSGSTLQKAIRFWVDAATFVGIKFPTTWEHIPRSMSAAPKRKRGAAAPKPDDPSQSPSPPKAASDGGQAKTVRLHGAIITLSAVATDLMELAEYPEELKWFQELNTKFLERAKAPQT